MVRGLGSRARGSEFRRLACLVWGPLRMVSCFYPAGLYPVRMGLL